MFKNFRVRKINKKKLIIALIIFIFIVLLAIFSILYFKVPAVQVFFDKYLFRKNVTEGTLPYVITESSNVYAFNNNILEQNENTLTFYNKNGSEETSLTIKVVNPIVHTNGRYLVIAENGGQKAYLISDKNIVWEKDIEGSISNVYVNKSGYVGISLTDTTYKSIINLYNSDGNELFKIYRSNTYVMDFAISSDDKNLAFAEIDSTGAIVKSFIKVVDIDTAIKDSSNAIVYQSEAFSDSIVINIDYTRNNVLSCVYNDHIDVITNNSIREVTNFSNSNIIFADLNNKIIQIEKKADSLFNTTYELQIIDTQTFETLYYYLEKEPTSVDVFDNIIAINFGREALFINNNAWLIKNYTSYQEIQNISVSDNLATILLKDKTEIISL